MSLEGDSADYTLHTRFHNISLTAIVVCCIYGVDIYLWLLLFTPDWLLGLLLHFYWLFCFFAIFFPCWVSCWVSCRVRARNCGSLFVVDARHKCSNKFGRERVLLRCSRGWLLHPYRDISEDITIPAKGLLLRTLELIAGEEKVYEDCFLYTWGVGLSIY